MGRERSAPGNPVGLGVSAHRDVLALPPREALPVAASSSQATSGHSGTARPRPSGRLRASVSWGRAMVLSAGPWRRHLE